MPKADNKISESDMRFAEFKKSGAYTELVEELKRLKDERLKKQLPRGKRIQR